MSEKMTAEEFAAIYGINLHRGSNRPESVVGCKLPIRPAWTSEPPKEPGFYWCQYWRCSKGQYECGVAHVFEMRWPSYDFLAFYSTNNPMSSWDHVQQDPDCDNDHPTLWWPTPIPEPPR